MDPCSVRHDRPTFAFVPVMDKRSKTPFDAFRDRVPNIPESWAIRYFLNLPPHPSPEDYSVAAENAVADYEAYRLRTARKWTADGTWRGIPSSIDGRQSEELFVDASTRMGAEYPSMD